MFVPFENLPDSARIWIYPSERAFSDMEVEEINATLKQFADSWQSHQMPVKAYAAVFHHHFIVLAADDSQVAVGGCSIDSSMQIIRQIATQYNRDLFQRLNVFYRDEHNRIWCNNSSMMAFLVQKKTVNNDTIVFNPIISSKADLLNNWEVPFDKSAWFKII